MVDNNEPNDLNLSKNENDRSIQIQIQRCYSEAHRQSSIRSTKNVKTNNLHFKIRRYYSMLLVKYHWKILLAGFLLACLFTGLGFLKQPLPDIMDPSRGFGARGPGTLTSQLIVMKNINTELTKYNEHILKMYNEKKLKAKMDSEREYIDDDDNYNNNVEDLNEENTNSKRIKRDFVLSDEDELEHLLTSNVFKDLTGSDIRQRLSNTKLSSQNFLNLINEYNTCNFSHGLDENLEFYFNYKNSNELNNNLLTVDNLKSLCKWDQILINSLNFKSNCYISLPKFIQLLNNKTNCEDLNEKDIEYFRTITSKCSDVYQYGLLEALAEVSKQKSDIVNLIDKNKPINKFLKLTNLDEYFCAYKNFMFFFYQHLVDRDYTTQKSQVKYASLILSNPRQQPIYDNNFIFDYYLKNFHGSNYHYTDVNGTDLYGINLSGIRMEAAMRVIGAEMSLIALAITLIVIVTLLYLRSIFISMIVNLGVAVSVGVSFFFYRIVFGIVLFPFINMMAAFLLIGIACDDVYVLFDSWYTEKAKIIMEDLPEQLETEYTEANKTPQNDTTHTQTLPPIFIKNKFYKQTDEIEFFDSIKHSAIYKELKEKGININEYTLNMGYVRVAQLSDQQMIRVMSGTLHHAASSIFVTSFTTAAAFMTNLIAKLPSVQLFGFFTGSCILVYFILVITIIAAFVITYEKYLQNLTCKIKLKSLEKLEKFYEKFNETVSLINHKIICESLPKLIIKLRFVWFSLFLILGCIGMFIVFVQPKLKPNSKWRYEFFKNDNKFENFEFILRDEFQAYLTYEQRNLTNPEIFFVFGIRNSDTGRVFDPDDTGHLVYDTKFNFLSESSQLWLNNFINSSLNENRNLFLSDDIVKEWDHYLKHMQLFCSETLDLGDKLFTEKIYLPFESKRLEKCQEETNKMLTNSDLHEFEDLMAAFPRRIIFISNGKEVNGLILRVNANRTFIDFDNVDTYYHELVEFHDKYVKTAPDGLNTGWFISVAFALYDLQYQLITGTYSSLIASMIIAWVFLLFTSGNIFIAVYAIICISFSIADTIAIFVLMGWELSILESVVIIMSVGLSCDFSCHYGVAYINSDRDFNDGSKRTCFDYRKNNKERFVRIQDIFKRVGSAVFMAALTTFLAGLSMYPSGLTSFSKMGQFLMLVMCTSYLYSTFFFVSMCALIGPTRNFGDLNFKDWGLMIASACYKKAKSHTRHEINEEERLNPISLNTINNNNNNNDNNRKVVNS
ncbi:unnamed protein product [Brachionus calyciflorus]|uniref:SSD domain-containing protein n=1 Tax=Brachionus calyciflorus TaxID=104777 RepID=A0A813WBI9_9BILA|nr:unnamed protein product [Brachionus calyciflorus]